MMKCNACLNLSNAFVWKLFTLDWLTINLPNLEAGPQLSQKFSGPLHLQRDSWKEKIQPAGHRQGAIYSNELWFCCFLCSSSISYCICPYRALLHWPELGLTQVDREVNGANCKISYIINSCFKDLSKRMVTSLENVSFLLWQVPLKISI